MIPVPPLILIVEDEEKLARLLADYVLRAGYDAHIIGNANKVLPWLKSERPAAILLDLMLPGGDGLTLCRQIRELSTVPILITTARVEEIDRLLGLELGADDYICKPFSPREVMARLKAVLRRTGPDAGTAASEDRAVLVLEAPSLRVRKGHREESLTSVEFHLLDVMYREPSRVFSRSQLMDRIYSDRRIVSDRTIDSHVKKLRRKLASVAPELELIHAVYGAGYRYEPRPWKDPDPIF
jgi:two-component system response regulator BaeR